MIAYVFEIALFYSKFLVLEINLVLIAVILYVQPPRAVGAFNMVGVLKYFLSKLKNEHVPSILFKISN